MRKSRSCLLISGLLILTLLLLEDLPLPRETAENWRPLPSSQSFFPGEDIPGTVQSAAAGSGNAAAVTTGGRIHLRDSSTFSLPVVHSLRMTSPGMRNLEVLLLAGGLAALVMAVRLRRGTPS